MVMQAYNGSCYCGAIRFLFETEPFVPEVTVFDGRHVL